MITVLPFSNQNKLPTLLSLPEGATFMFANRLYLTLVHNDREVFCLSTGKLYSFDMDVPVELVDIEISIK
jgi:hypothetical protein